MGGGSEKQPKITYIRPGHRDMGGSKNFSMLPQLPSYSVLELSTRVPSAAANSGTAHF